MFSSILTDLLEQYDLSQSDLSRKVDIAKTTISGWLRLNKVPDSYALQKLSKFFGVSVDYLLGLEDDFGNKIVQNAAMEPEFKLLYKALSPSQQKNVKLYMRFLIENSKD